MHVVAAVPPVQGIPLCVIFGSRPALYLRPLYSSSRIEARKCNQGPGTGAEGEGGICHGQCGGIFFHSRPQLVRGRPWCYKRIFFQ